MIFFEADNLVEVPALPVTLPTIGLVTVKLPKVPTLVKLEPMTVEFNAVPVNVPASAGTVISVLPSKATPLIFFEADNLVEVPALPVTLPTIGLVTVKFVKVPTLVKLEPITVEFNAVPVNVPAAAGRVISAVPSNAIPLIFLAVANFVAVAALPTEAKSVALAIHFQEVPA